MGFGLVAGLATAGLASFAMAQDLLFHSSMIDTQEYTRATSVLGYTVHVATPEEWNGYTTADFEKYKAIIIPDPTCGTVDEIDFFDATKTVWGPAIMGNIILIGTDPSFHASSRPGALTLIDDGVRFSASGNGTGLYFALSCYYDSVAASTVNALSYFGTITVRGQLACYNDAHLVANSSALGKLDDGALSDWSCSVHEVFTSYPTTGLFGFEPLAIAEGATGDGQRDFADGSNGIPYIIVKGATPAGCGDGVWDPSLEEECDDGPLNGTPESFCSSSCKCLTGSIAPGLLYPNGELYAGPDKFKHRLLAANFISRSIYQFEFGYYYQRNLVAIFALKHYSFLCFPTFSSTWLYGTNLTQVQSRSTRFEWINWIDPYGFRHFESLESACILHRIVFQPIRQLNYNSYYYISTANKSNPTSARIDIWLIARRVFFRHSKSQHGFPGPVHTLGTSSHRSLYDGWGQHTCDQWHFFLSYTGAIVRIGHKFQHSGRCVYHTNTCYLVKRSGEQHRVE
ncbi:hypothetical protein VP1G_05525 [Cytospora mali]|uniref:Uncharacterized protein n=1 Tax=Cytospora mali TaxID=578113 RepID=A0A194V2V4_CYTMA|nr:hypothetical protein VP1G_05525 [Valsa mali var. pyri (nom. inval.)]